MMVRRCIPLNFSINRTNNFLVVVGIRLLMPVMFCEEDMKRMCLCLWLRYLRYILVLMYDGLLVYEEPAHEDSCHCDIEEQQKSLFLYTK